MSVERRFQIEVLPDLAWKEFLRCPDPDERSRHLRAGSAALITDASSLKTKMARACDELGRDPSTLRHSFLMFDANAREADGYLFYWESVEQFADVVGQSLDLGFDEIGVYYPVDAQRDVFERVAAEVILALRGQ